MKKIILIAVTLLTLSSYINDDFGLHKASTNHWIGFMKRALVAPTESCKPFDPTKVNKKHNKEVIKKRKEVSEKEREELQGWKKDRKVEEIK